MNGLDWDTPLNASGNERTAALRAALGLNSPELDSFLEMLEADLIADAWGFKQLAELEGEMRALVSDQLLSAAYGIQDALADASAARREVHECTGVNGIPFPRAEDSLNDMLRGLTLQRAVAGFFDAVGTALDCLAGVLVVVTRSPLSVQRADFGRLRGLNPDANPTGFPAQIPDIQRQLWHKRSEALAAAEQEAGPDGWLEWSLEMRNALTHRRRVTNILLPRATSTRLVLPHTAHRYDYYLRRRPWLPEIEGLVAADDLLDSILDEPAEQTIDGLHGSLITFSESLIAFARQHWANEGDLVAPVESWRLQPGPEIDFAGIAPETKIELPGAISGINQEHLQLAERLRLARQKEHHPGECPGE
jgi:hypothetical protein